MKKVIIIRGGGDLATGVAHTLKECGFAVAMLEIENPSAIRRKVSYCECLYEGEVTIEGIIAKRAKDVYEASDMLRNDCKEIPVIVDPKGTFIEKASALGLEAMVVVDAVLAKYNTGTTKDMAPLTIALGPGFTAGAGFENGIDVDAVVETKRGHNLGRIILNGEASSNTGIPGIIGGFGKDRVMHSPAEGSIEVVCHIGDIVKKGDVLAYIHNEGKRTPLLASLDGVLRGLIRNDYPVKKGLKVADIDPRKEEQQNCFTISDKSRALGNAVLRAIIMISQKKAIPIW